MYQSFQITFILKRDNVKAKSILHGQHESTLILFHLFLMIIVEGKKKTQEIFSLVIFYFILTTCMFRKSSVVVGRKLMPVTGLNRPFYIKNASSPFLDCPVGKGIMQGSKGKEKQQQLW